MLLKKLSAFLLCLSLLLALCACGDENEVYVEDTGFEVSLQAEAGSGYYWDCTLSKTGVVDVAKQLIHPDKLSPGSEFTTVFRFTGVKEGSVTADFSCSQSWNDTVQYLYTCELTVDRERAVSGELSRQTARIRPGDGSYKLTAGDTSIALWEMSSDGVYSFTPLRSGSTVLTFTSADKSIDTNHVFYLTVTDGGTLSITEDHAVQDSEAYDTMELLEKSVGIPMPLPDGAEPEDISSAGGIAYVSFVWNGSRLAYAGGALNFDELLSPDAEVTQVDGHKVIIRNGLFTLAAWESSGFVYCISSDDILTTKQITLLLEDIFE